MSTSKNQFPGQLPPSLRPAPDPTSERILSKLKPFLESFCAPIRREPGDPPVRFGHITIPPYRLREPSLLELMGRALPSTGDKTDLRPFFVMSDFEFNMITDETLGELTKRALPSVVTGFVEILQALRRMRCGDGSGRNAWDSIMDPMGWEKKGGIPGRAVIIIQLDSRVSADSALALISLVQWVFDVSVNANTSLHVLTMSTDPGYNIVPALAKLRCPEIVVAELDLAILADQDPVANAKVVGEKDVASKIDEAIARGGTRPIAVIMFEYVFIGQNLPESAVDAFHLDDARHISRFNSSRRWKRNLPRVLMLILKGNLPLVPTALEGYDEIHVVLGSSYWDIAWHNDAGQLAQYSRATAHDERRDQLWWARQPDAKATYVYTGGSSIKAFLEAGHHRHRLIEDTQLGGFVASVFDMQSWGIDPKRVVRRCVQAPALDMTMEMLDRLKLQRVISQSGFILPKPDDKAFRSILPLVDYDHRLALFVALDSGNPDHMVRMVKVQLAALAVFGLERIFSFNSPEQDLWEMTEKHPHLPSMVYGACVGYGRSLATRGTMWLSLGLWKHFLSTDYAPHNPKAKALHSLVRVDRGLSQMAEDRANEMFHALRTQGIMVPPGIQVAREVNEIDMAQQSQLQAHLLQAFLHQLIAVHRPNESSELAHDLIATDTPVYEIRLNESIAGILPIDQIHETDATKCSFGVCHLLRKMQGKSAFSAYDWTHIPVSIVAQWKDQTAPDVRLCDTLASGIPRLPGNCDEWCPVEDP